MYFASDNAGPVVPEALEALTRVNQDYALAYGNDALTTKVQDQIRTLFEAPEARVFLVASGTATNVLALGTITRPWEAIFCHEFSHIQVSECNAPEFYTGGAKLLPLPGPSGRIDPDALKKAMSEFSTGAMPDTRTGPVSITQVTDLGGVYSLEEIRAVTKVAKSFGSLCHLDGARFANAMVVLGCSPAEMTWKAGIDVVSFGGTKNGLMGAEAVIFFDPAHASEFEHRRRRGAHLLSKQRYMAAQYEAYFENDLWLDLARKANSAAARLSGVVEAIPGAVLDHPCEANMIFASWPRALHQKLRAAGAVYYMASGDSVETGDPEARLPARLVTNWATTDADINAFAEIISI